DRREEPLAAARGGGRPGDEGGPDGWRRARPATAGRRAIEDHVVAADAGDRGHVRHDPAIEVACDRWLHADVLPLRPGENGADAAAGCPAAGGRAVRG